MKKTVAKLAVAAGLAIFTVGCAQTAVLPSQVGAINESFTGVVTAVEDVKIQGDGKWTTVGGAVLGGVTGHQFGGGGGKDLLTMGGAVIGGMLGMDADIREGQNITVQFDSGKTITTILPTKSDNPVKYKVGDRVTVFIAEGKVTEIR